MLHSQTTVVDEEQQHDARGRNALNEPQRANGVVGGVRAQRRVADLNNIQQRAYPAHRTAQHRTAPHHVTSHDTTRHQITSHRTTSKHITAFRHPTPHQYYLAASITPFVFEIACCCRYAKGQQDEGVDNDCQENGQVLQQSQLV